MDTDIRLKRLRYRAWHRGTREADLMIGGYFDARSGGWGEAELAWFEALLEEQDVDIMAWALGTLPCPARWEGDAMQSMRTLDFVPLPSSLSSSGETERHAEGMARERGSGRA